MWNPEPGEINGLAKSGRYNITIFHPSNMHKTKETPVTRFHAVNPRPSYDQDITVYTVRKLLKFAVPGARSFSGGKSPLGTEELVLARLAPGMVLQADFADISQLFLESYSEMMTQFASFCDNTVICSRVTKIVEASLVFGVNLLRASGGVDIFLALTSLMQAVKVSSVSQSVYDYMVGHFADSFAQTFEVQAFDVSDLSPLLDSLRSKFTLFSNINEVPIVKKLFKFVLYCLSFSMLEIFGITFDKLGYSRFEAEAIRKAHSSKSGFVFCIFDSLTLFMKQFVRAVSSGSWEPFYHCTTAYEKFVDDAIALKNREKYLSNPEPHGFDLFTYRSELEDALDRGNTIVRHLSTISPYERAKLKALVADLAVLKANDITRKSAQRDRPAPFGILLAGGSSLGKSTLITYLFQYYAKLHNRSSESTAKYTRNSAEKHWNGFASSQWCIVLDDIAAQNPNLGSMDESLSEVICVLNNVAFVPEQAALEDKGKTPVLAELVIASTNTVDLNAHAYFSCPLAVQRRLPWIVNVEVKEEFATNRMLDHTKCDGSKVNGRYADYWRFKVEKIVPAASSAGRGQRGKGQVVALFDHVEDFLQWFGKETFIHNSVQTLIGVQEIDTNTILACEVCCRPCYDCSCEAIEQADVMQFALVPYQAVGRIVDAGIYWLRPFQCFVHFFTAHAWCECDTEDLQYSLCVLLFCFCGFFLTFLVGPLVAWMTGLTGWFSLKVTSFDFERRFLRFIFRRMGSRMEQMQGPVKVYLLFFLTLATAAKMAHMAVTYVFVPKCKCQETVSSVMEPPVVISSDTILESVSTDFSLEAEVGTRPVPMDKERTNVWYKEEFNVTSFDVTPQTISMKALPKDQVRNMLRRNCVRLQVSVDGSTWVRTGALALCGQLYAVNSHAFKSGDSWIIRYMPDAQTDGIRRNKEFVVTSCQMYTQPHTDVHFVRLHGLPLAANILPYLVLPSLKGLYDGEYVGYDKEGNSVAVNTVRHIVQSGFAYTPDHPTLIFRGVSSRLSEKGDCGMPLLVFTPLGPVIFGIHSLGCADRSVGVAPVFADVARAALDFFKVLELQSGCPMLTAPSARENILGPLAVKSPFRYMEQGSAIVYGSFGGFRSAPKSSVKRTIMASVAEDHGYVQKFGAPVMSGWVPWRLAALDMVDTPAVFRQDIVDHCVASFTSDILRDLPVGALSQLHVYDQFTAVNGAAGVTFVDKMKRTTSAGFPWCCSKSKFLHAVEPQFGLQDPVEFSEEINDRVQQIIGTYKSGSVVRPVFTAHLKDEPTSFGKIAMSKTRVFGGAPVDWSIVVRMYYLSLIRLVQGNRYVFEGAPGTIAQSAEWGDMYHYLTAFGADRMVAGDFKSFDKKMPANIILAAFQVLINICEEAGYATEDLLVMSGVAYDTAFPLFNFNGDLVAFYGSNPSGHPLTVIINGLANALYMRYCYVFLCPEQRAFSFKSMVHLMTYGDDNAMGVSVDAPWFNHTTIQQVLAQHRVVYTMADKTAVSVPYLPMCDVSFLKRSWRWDSDVGAYLCPLELESIEKSIMTCVVSKSVSPEYQAIAIVSSAVGEYFFYGKKEFDARVSVLKTIVCQSGLDEYVEESTFPTFQLLKERFHSYDVELYWTPQA